LLPLPLNYGNFGIYGNYGNPVRGFGFDVQLPNYQLTKLPNSRFGQCCFDYKIDSRIRIDDASETNSGLDRGRFSVHAQGAARHHRR
jgi:hypothetical protein